jgi:hypothetical protein
MPPAVNSDGEESTTSTNDINFMFDDDEEHEILDHQGLSESFLLVATYACARHLSHQFK